MPRQKRFGDPGYQIPEIATETVQAGAEDELPRVASETKPVLSAQPRTAIAALEPDPEPMTGPTWRDQLVEQFMRGPDLEGLPERPRPTVGGALKEFGMNLIPGYGMQRARRENWEESEVKRRNDQRLEKYQQMGQIVRPLLTKDYEATAWATKAATMEAFLMQRYPMLTPIQRASLVSGRSVPREVAPKAGRPIQIEMQDGSEAPAVWNPNSNQFELNGNPVPWNLIKSVKAEKDPREREFEDNKQRWYAAYRQRHGMAPDAKLDPIQEEEAYNEGYHRLHPTYPPGFGQRDRGWQLVQSTGPDGRQAFVGFNPDTLQTRAVASPWGDGTGLLQPKPSVLTAQARTKFAGQRNTTQTVVGRLMEILKNADAMKSAATAGRVKIMTSPNGALQFLVSRNMNPTKQEVELASAYTQLAEDINVLRIAFQAQGFRGHEAWMALQNLYGQPTQNVDLIKANLSQTLEGVLGVYAMAQIALMKDEGKPAIPSKQVVAAYANAARGNTAAALQMMLNHGWEVQ